MHGFANLAFSEFLLNDCRIERTRNRLVVHLLRCGCEIAEMLPSARSSWWRKLMEKILCSSAVQSRHRLLLLECVDHKEFTHCAMDDVVRQCRRIRGQEDYLCSKKKRNFAPIPDTDAIRNILNVRGRTGAVALTHPVKGNPGRVFADALLKELPLEVRQQVLTMAADNPSLELFNALRNNARGDSASSALPNLLFLSLDPTH